MGEPPRTDDEQEYRSLAVKPIARERFDELKRRVEVAENTDLTQTEMVVWLIQHAPDPLGTAGGEDDENE